MVHAKLVARLLTTIFDLIIGIKTGAAVTDESHEPEEIGPVSIDVLDLSTFSEGDRFWRHSVRIIQASCSHCGGAI